MRHHLFSVLIGLAGCSAPAAGVPDLATPDGLFDADGGAADEPLFDSPAGLVRVVGIQQPFAPRNEVSARFYQGAPPGFHREAKREGSCRLLTFQLALCRDYCNGVCTDTDVCKPFPERSSAGPVVVSGTSRPVTLDPGTGSYYNLNEIIPGELFSPGAAVTASASGASFPGFRLTTAGVATFSPPSIVNDEITLRNDADYTFTWLPGPDPAARVRLTLNSTNEGHGLPYKGIIECDAPDRAGALTLRKELITDFPATQRWDGCVRIDCPMSSALRYRRATADTTSGRVALIVGSQKQLWVLHSAK